jgi:predicted aspartyl protease
MTISSSKQRSAIACPFVIVAVLSLSACIAVQEPAPDSVALDTGEVRFDLAGPGDAALVVDVRVNDAGPFPFVFDTGATLTCVDEALARELQLPEAAGVLGFGGGVRGLGTIRLVDIDTVSLGQATVRGLRGCTVDLAPMQKAGLDVRGLLGLNFLKAYSVVIDFPTNRIRLIPPEATRVDGTGISNDRPNDVSAK